MLAVIGLVASSAIVAVQAPAVSATAEEVLILDGTVTGGLNSIEASQVTANGLTPVLVSADAWRTMTASDFSQYRAIVLGDPTCQSRDDDVLAAESNAMGWGSTVNGNVIINGTDPVYHSYQGGEELTRRAIDFAVAQPGKTGAYVSLSCYYHDTAPSTPVPMLDGIAGGGFTVTGVGCFNNAHIVAEHPALADLNDATLSNWSCSVHEAFDNWPGALVPLAIAMDFDSSFTASDGTQGPPYILAGGDIRSFPLSLSPLDSTGAPGTSHTITASLVDKTTREPVSGALIDFSVVAGPNVGVAGSCIPTPCRTDSEGLVQMTYRSNGETGRDTIQAVYDMDEDGFADAGEPRTTAGRAWQASSSGGVVVSFGDSIAAGEGLGPHKGYPNNSDAYSGRIGAKLGWTSYNFAISGACAATSGQGGVWGTPSECTKSVIRDQIPAAAELDLDPDVVTITVGANDIRFSSCVLGVLGFDDASPCTGKVFSDHLRALQLNLSVAIAQIRDLYGPDVPIAVTRYFSPMPGYVAAPEPVCPLMPAAVLAKTYFDHGGKAAVWALRDLDSRARDYQASVSDKTLTILGRLNKTLSTAATPFGATMVGLNFSGHDFCADYDGQSDAWVFAPYIDVFASYSGAGGATWERTLVPSHRCIERPECDTTTKFINESGVWKGQRWTLNVIFLSNDFPHLTKPGQDAVADRIIEAVGL